MTWNRLLRYITIFLVSALSSSCDSLDANTMLVKSDAIVILAGNRQERTPLAAELYRRGYADMIILTNDGVKAGWSKKYGRNLYQVEWTEEELINSGVPRQRIVTLPFYRSGTVYDALAVKRYVTGKAITSLILVTSDFHARRTLWTFRNVHGDTVKDISVSTVRSSGNVLVHTFTEFVKQLYYLFRFRIFGFPQLPS